MLERNISEQIILQNPKVDLPPSGLNSIIRDSWCVSWQDPANTDAHGWAVKVKSELPVLLYVARRITSSRSGNINLFCFDARVSVNENAVRLVTFLTRMAAIQGIWAPISSNHSLLLLAMNKALVSLCNLDLSDSPMIFIGDSNNEKSFSELSTRLDMPFYFQACL